MHFVGLLFAASACYAEVELPECGTTQDCPPHKAACIDGRCFHHALDYAVPLCGVQSDGTCCDFTGAGMEGCQLWTIDQWDSLSAPVAVLADGIVFSAASDGKLLLVAVDSSGESLWSHSLGDLGDDTVPLPQPAVNGKGEIAVAAFGTVYRYDSSGTLLRQVDLDLEVAGAIAHCDDSDVYLMAGAKTVIDIPPNSEPIARQFDGGFQFQSVKQPLGPVVFPKEAIVVVPDEDGERLAALSLNLNQTLWVHDQNSLVGQILGLAAGPGPTVYAMPSQTVLALDPTVSEEAQSYRWMASVARQNTLLTAAPVLNVDQQLMTLTDQGDLVFFSKTQTSAPGTVFSSVYTPALFTSPAVWLTRRQAALASTPSGLAFLVPPGTLPDPKLDHPSIHLLQLQCQKLEISTPRRNGVLAIACDNRLLGFVAPDFQLDNPWPTPRGPTRSGCLRQP